MKTVLIQQFLKEHDIDLEQISLGEFDEIGEICARKARDKGSPLYKSVGKWFKPSYERGILIYSLIKRYKLKSFLEVGFGRGHSAVAAAKAFYDIGIDGKVTSIDPVFDKNQLELMSQTFPKEWLEKIELKQGYSQEVLKTLDGPFDFVFVDGDHRAPAVASDWNMLKDKWNSFLLFDDYHLPTKKEADIECAQVIDRIDETKFDATKTLVKLDRRIFLDDRGYTDEMVDYGMVVLQKNSLTKEEW